jgi:hypothetical protein
MRGTWWWTAIRRSYAPYFLPVALGIAYFARSTEPTEDYRFEWLWASVDSGRWLVLGAAVVTGATAWEAWLARRRLREFEAGLPNPAAARLAIWAGGVFWWSLLHTGVLGWHLWEAARAGAVGTLSATAVVSQYLAIAGWCALGAAVGWWARTPLAPVALALVVVGVTVLNVSIMDRKLRAVTWFGSVRSLVGLEFDTGWILLRLLFFAGLLALVGTAVRFRLVDRVAVSSGLVLAVVAAVLVTDARRVELIPVAVSHHVCEPRRDGIQVCGVPELRSWFPTIADQLAGPVGRLRSLGVQPPASYRLYGPEAPAEVMERGVGVVRLALGDLRRGVGVTPAVVAAATVPYACVGPGEEPSGEFVTVGAVFYGWLLRELGQDAPGTYPEPLVDQIHMSDAATRHSWLAQTYQKLWRCDMTGYAPPPGAPTGTPSGAGG